MNRNKLVAGALALVVAAGGIGWFVGSRIKSPAEIASEAKPPTPSLITVAVEKRVLSADVVSRGNIAFDDPISLSVSGANADPDAKPIVTMVPEVGAELGPGSVALEVAGRPVILLPGELPVYRDMRPGSKGHDVEQLEKALVELGLLDRADDVWDNRTGAAVQGLYARVGYTAAATSESDQQALQGARDSVKMAAQSLSDAEKALKEFGQVGGSTLLQLQAEVNGAKAALEQARIDRTNAISEAQGQVTIAQNRLEVAKTALALAQARRDQAVDDGVHPDTNQPPTAVEVEELELALKNAAVEETEANNALQAAVGQVTSTTKRTDGEVAAAQDRVKIAEAQLREGSQPGDKTQLIRMRDDARQELKRASEALAKFESTVGTWFPSGELIFVKTLPVQVTNVMAQRGYGAEGNFMTVSGADIAMTVGVSESDAKRLNVGDRVIVNEPDLVEGEMEGVIARIPEASGTSGRVTLVVQFETIPEHLLGSNLRVIIPVKSTDGEVLVVPAAALSATANGDTRVEVELADKPGETRFVTVQTGLAADGVVEVRPVDGELKPGDRVVVGQADIGPAGGNSGSGDTGDGDDEDEDTAEIEPAVSSDG